MTALQNEASIECRKLHRPAQELSGAELDAVNGGKYMMLGTLFADAVRKHDEMLQSIARNIR